MAKKEFITLDELEIGVVPPHRRFIQRSYHPSHRVLVLTEINKKQKYLIYMKDQTWTPDQTTYRYLTLPNCPTFIAYSLPAFIAEMLFDDSYFDFFENTYELKPSMRIDAALENSKDRNSNHPRSKAFWDPYIGHLYGEIMLDDAHIPFADPYKMAVLDACSVGKQWNNSSPYIAKYNPSNPFDEIEKKKLLKEERDYKVRLLEAVRGFFERKIIDHKNPKFVDTFVYCIN